MQGTLIEGEVFHHGGTQGHRGAVEMYSVFSVSLW